MLSLLLSPSRVLSASFKRNRMICSHCGSKVEDEKRFCGDCGSALAWVCACGGQNPPNKRFCSDCGAPHDARNGGGRKLPAAQEAERRLLTAMFVDLVGSTSLSARLDPEDLRSVIAAFYRCVTEIVGRLDGFVARYMGQRGAVRLGDRHCGCGGRQALHRHTVLPVNFLIVFIALRAVF